MALKIHRVFLDTRVVFAGVLSATSGARQLFRLGEAGVLKLLIGPNVLRECEEVVRRKAPGSLALLARFLSSGQVETVPGYSPEPLALARAVTAYEPDARVLAEALVPAEAIAADPDWFVTHDKVHFLQADRLADLGFRLGTPGDLIQAIKDDLSPG